MQRPSALAGNEKIITLTEDNGLKKEIIQEGTGQLIPNDVTAIVHYTGKLTSGQVFDSSKNRGKPYTFNVGRREVILGWDKGVATMRKGEICILTCSPDYAYGSRGAGGVIPPNSTLIFEVIIIFN
jgi:FKBP-type peptidyl-prolyl cis-trans isomerase